MPQGKKRTTLDPEQKQEIVDAITTALEKRVEEFLREKMVPRLQGFAREEVGRYALTEKEAISMFSEWLVTDAQKIVCEWFRPRWFFRFFFRRK